jgi:hypothetical protein
MTEWRSPFDQAMAESGPAAVFTLDHGGRLGIDEARTRETWCRLAGPDGREACHCLFRDRATGFVQYVLVTAVNFYEAHPRADTVRYSSAEEAMSALAQLGPMPIQNA